MLITLDNISRLVDNIKTWVSNNFISKDTQGGEIIYNCYL